MENQQNQGLFFEKTNKIGKRLARLLKNKQKRSEQRLSLSEVKTKQDLSADPTAVK